MRTIFVEEAASESEEREGFFARQFAPSSTPAQNIFDVVFGVVGPVLCFFFDPIVFRGGMLGAGSPLLGRFQLIAYTISLIQIPLLAVWLLSGRQLSSFSAPLGGVLIAGSIFSFLVGTLILPYSLLGLIILIGLFGFTPFVTGFVYLRNGVRAFAGQERNSTYSFRFLIGALAAVLAIGLPLFANQIVNETTSRSVYQIVNGDAQQVDFAVNQMRWMPFIPQENLNSIITAYQASKDPERRELLSKAYKELAGEDIDTRIMILND